MSVGAERFGAWQSMVNFFWPVWKCSNDKKTNFSAENQMKAGEAGGIETMVKVLEAHINNFEICKQGCMAIMVMAVNSKAKRKKKT